MNSEVVQLKTIRSRHTVYTVKNVIGKGRFSCVYQATDMTTDDTVVIKKLHKKYVSDDDFEWYLYLKELTVLTKLKSSPVRARYVNLREAMRLETGAVCFVMEKLGTTLHSVLFNIGVLPMSMCRMIVRQIAQGAFFSRVSCGFHFPVILGRGTITVIRVYRSTAAGGTDGFFRGPYERRTSFSAGQNDNR